MNNTRSKSMKFTSPKLFYSFQNPITNADSFLNTRKSHAQILKSGFSVFDSLFQSYLNSGEESLPSAFGLLDEIAKWDSPSANSIIMFLRNHNHPSHAIHLFSRLPSLSVDPNRFIFCNVVSAATALRDPSLGRQLHAGVIKTGFADDVYVGSSLLDHHSKLGSPIEDCQKVFVEIHKPNVVAYTTLIGGLLKKHDFNAAYSVFQHMLPPERSVVTWNAMIGGCSKMGRNEEAVDLFTKMLKEGLVPTKFTFPSVFTAVSNIAGFGMGRTIHAISIKSLPSKENPNIYVASSLISFYAKCGSMDDSVLVFERAREMGGGDGVVVWNAMVCGYAQNGRGREALVLYRKMSSTSSSGVMPNDVTLLGVLFGCNHGGLVDDGYECFRQAEVNCPEMLRPEHYACVVNLFSRSGRFGDAEKFLSELPFRPGVGFWKAFLVGFQTDRSNIDMVRRRIEGLMNPASDASSSYVLLSNAYAASGGWQKTSVIRQEMKDGGIDIIPGCSWIEVRGEMHVFYNGDPRHPHTCEICNVLAIFQRTKLIIP